MPLLSRRCAAEKSSLRSLNALPSKAFRAFDPTRGGLPPPRAPPPTLGRIRLNRGFSTSCAPLARYTASGAFLNPDVDLPRGETQFRTKFFCLLFFQEK